MEVLTLAFNQNYLVKGDEVMKTSPVKYIYVKFVT